jgi:hypothetical protein
LVSFADVASQFTRPAPSSLKSWSVISFDNRFQVGDMREFGLAPAIANQIANDPAEHFIGL